MQLTRRLHMHKELHDQNREVDRTSGPLLLIYREAQSNNACQFAIAHPYGEGGREYAFYKHCFIKKIQPKYQCQTPLCDWTGPHFFVCVWYTWVRYACVCVCVSVLRTGDKQMVTASLKQPLTSSWLFHGDFLLKGTGQHTHS